MLAITVLTDMLEEECQAVYCGSINQVVLRFALMAKEADMDGIVCSPQELRFLIGEFEELLSLKKVTPNIRPGSVVVHGDDQNPKRKANECEAIEWGSDWLVIGRAITQADDPVAAVHDINHRINLALESKTT